MYTKREDGYSLQTVFLDKVKWGGAIEAALILSPLVLAIPAKRIAKRKKYTNKIWTFLEETIDEISTPKKGTSQPETSISKEDVLETIKSLNELKEQGVITQEEFDVKKAELLKRI